MNKTEKTVYELAEPIAAEYGCYIYNVEFVKEGLSRYLRVFADKDEGITVDECELISRSLSDILDEADPIKENYFLEISSPGIGRKLSLPWHFEKYLGFPIDVSLYKPVCGAKKYTGELAEYNGGDFTIVVESGNITFGKNDIADVHLHYDF